MKITKRQLRRIIKEEVKRTLHINEDMQGDYESKQFTGEKGNWTYAFAPFKKKWALQYDGQVVAQGPTSDKGSVPKGLVAAGGDELGAAIYAWQEANADNIKFSNKPGFKTLTKDGKLFPDLKLADDTYMDDDDDYSDALLSAIDAAEEDFLDQWGY